MYGKVTKEAEGTRRCKHARVPDRQGSLWGDPQDAGPGGGQEPDRLAQRAKVGCHSEILLRSAGTHTECEQQASQLGVKLVFVDVELPASSAGQEALGRVPQAGAAAHEQPDGSGGETGEPAGQGHGEVLVGGGGRGILQVRADPLSDAQPLQAFWQRRQAEETGQRRYRRVG